jgi:hypothetical protein
LFNFGCLTSIAYRDKKVVGVFCAFFFRFNLLTWFNVVNSIVQIILSSIIGNILLLWNLKSHCFVGFINGKWYFGKISVRFSPTQYWYCNSLDSKLFHKPKTSFLDKFFAVKNIPFKSISYKFTYRYNEY